VNITDDLVNRIVEHLCQHLHVAIQLKGPQSEVRPPNLKDLGFDRARVRTVLLTSLHGAGVTVADHALTETEPPGPDESAGPKPRASPFHSARPKFSFVARLFFRVECRVRWTGAAPSIGQ
jgi:hypothetical protein